MAAACVPSEWNVDPGQLQNFEIKVIDSKKVRHIVSIWFV